MIAFSTGHLNQLLHPIFWMGLIVAWVAWAWCSRRRPHTPLSQPLRINLLVLLAATPFAWRSVTNIIESERFDGNTGFNSELAEAMDIALPQSVSFLKAELKTIDHKNVLMLLPPSRLEWMIDSSVSAVSFSFGFDPLAYEQGQTDGVTLSLELEDPALKRLVFQHHLNPAQNLSDQGSHHEVVILPPRSRSSKLVLRTDAGPTGDNAWDWIYLSNFYLSKADSHALQQFPGFNRKPDKIVVDNTGLFQGEDGKPFLFIATPGVLSFTLQATDRHLQLDYGFMKSAYINGGQTNGILLQIEFRPSNGQSAVLFEYYARPLQHEADRNLMHASVVLPRHHSGDKVLIKLLPGDNNNNSWDHTFIRHLSLD